MEGATVETRESELEKMLAGKEYDSRDPVLFGMRRQTRAALNKYNADRRPKTSRRFSGTNPKIWLSYPRSNANTGAT